MLRRKTRLMEGEARDEGASAELSDMRRRGSLDAQRDTSQGEECARREAVGLPEREARTPQGPQGAARYPADEALRRVSPRRRRERRRRERERGRDPEHRAELPRVPCAACFAAASGAEPAKMRRVAQDCDPKTYMYMSSGRKDARIGHFSWYPPTTEGRSPRSGCPSRGASTAPHVRNSGLRRVSRRECERN